MKIVLTVVFLFIITFFAFGQTSVVYPTNSERAVEYGIGLGSAIAITISWSRNKSVLFAFIHGLFGWLYVIYFLLTRNDESQDKS